MNRKKLRAQAALEFLTTYGWAFLVILIMIGALAYFGILRPGALLPNRCTFGSELQCMDHQLKAAEVRVKLKNGVGEPIEVTTITLTKEDGTTITCTTPPTNPTGWKSGESKDLTWLLCSSTGLVAGNKGKVLINIKYYATASSSTYTKEVNGEIYSTVQ